VKCLIELELKYYFIYDCLTLNKSHGLKMLKLVFNRELFLSNPDAITNLLSTYYYFLLENKYFSFNFVLRKLSIQLTYTFY